MAGVRIPNQYFTNHGSDPYAAAANGINAIAWAMLKNAKTPEELEAIREQAELRRAQAEHYSLQNQALRDAAGQDSKMRDIFVQNISGATAPQMGAMREFQQTGSWGEPVSVDLAPGYGQSQPASAEMHGITPAMMNAARGAEAAFAARGKGNADSTIKGVQNAMETDTRGGALASGDITKIGQTQRALDGTGPIFSTNSEGIVTNALTGSINESGEIAQAMKKKVVATAGKEGALAGKAQAEAEGIRGENRLMYATNPETGEPLVDENGQKVALPAKLVLPNQVRVYTADRSATARETSADKAAAAKGQKSQKQLAEENNIRRDLGITQGQAMTADVIREIGADKGVFPSADLGFTERIVSEAAAIKQANPQISAIDAARTAYRRIAPEVQRKGMFDGTITMPAEKPASDVASTMTSAAQPAPAAAAPATPAQIPKAKNKADVDAAIAAANKAIKAGKDPAAVKKRLADMGIQLQGAN